METASEGIKTVCCISVGIFIIDFLCSATKLKKQMKFLLSMVFLAVLITPLISGTRNIDLGTINDIINTDEFEVSAELCDNVLENEIENNISEIIAAEFEQNGVETSKLEIDVNISQTNSIDIKRVTINTEQYSEAKQILIEKLGKEVEIVNEAE